MARTETRTVPPPSSISTSMDNASLDSRGPAGYCVFGKVIDGMDVVDKIKDVPTAVNRTGRDR